MPTLSLSLSLTPNLSFCVSKLCIVNSFVNMKMISATHDIRAKLKSTLRFPCACALSIYPWSIALIKCTRTFNNQYDFKIAAHDVFVLQTKQVNIERTNSRENSRFQFVQVFIVLLVYIFVQPMFDFCSAPTFYDWSSVPFIHMHSVPAFSFLFFHRIM